MAHDGIGDVAVGLDGGALFHGGDEQHLQLQAAEQLHHGADAVAGHLAKGFVQQHKADAVLALLINLQQRRADGHIEGGLVLAAGGIAADPGQVRLLAGVNEYTSLDFEMGYIDSFEDIMEMETGFLQYTMKLLETEYAKELKMLGVTLPKVDEIPQVRFDKAKELVAEKYNRKIRNPFDLEPEEESLIGQYFKEEMDADFVFVTHYPSKKRPFYAMDDPEDTNYTLSFDLLFRGLEITTGGQRIHDYLALVDKIADRGMTQEGMEQYMMIFKHGMPPHGGLGIGLERLTMKILGEDNVRETTLFPRDLSRLEP